MNDNKALHLTANEQVALDEIKGGIQALFSVEQFILFGSKARGDDHEFSDIDVLAVIESRLSGDDKRKISDAVFEVNLKWNTQFSIISVASADFHDEVWSRLPLFRAVASEGIIV
ncbi:MAG: nucleotidyltransferase domain-containing protein [Chitinivibrionales bacterium]|nr:nucleotidyltransferase domain-containing protein [Chitinivibrionales bacterium]